MGRRQSPRSLTLARTMLDVLVLDAVAAARREDLQPTNRTTKLCRAWDRYESCFLTGAQGPRRRGSLPQRKEATDGYEAA